ncbi:unnamed protein product [Ilex paraguariensis]|uniref:Small ribosomal subunit protein eS4 C-terminal domain-containing protein n=1 Tax=Ilex paraguariensis TaxID=185542 RepID=A0ABC8UPZ1_9AQUA
MLVIGVIRNFRAAVSPISDIDVLLWNRGRVGVLKNREKRKGSFETVHIQDALGHEFATRLGNVYTIGKGTKPWVSLPKGKGIKLSIIEEAKKRLTAQSAVTA